MDTIWWNGTDTVYRNSGDTAPFDTTQRRLECCCCDITLNSCSPALSKTYTVTIPASCALTTCDGTSHSFAGTHTVYHACLPRGLGTNDWYSPELDESGRASGTWYVQLDYVFGQWFVLAYYSDDVTTCRYRWSGPTTACDPTGTYTASGIEGTGPCANCAHANCNANAVVS